MKTSYRPLAWLLFANRRPGNNTIIGAGTFCLAETGLILGLLVQRSRRRRVEKALLGSRDEIRNLANRLIVAQEDERKRIARELHDDLCQQIAALGILVSTTKRELSTSHPAFGRLEELQRRLRLAGDEVRELSHELHPAVLEYSGLDAALRKQADEFTRRSGISVTFENSVDRSVRLPSEIALCFYRVAQEALRNLEKHSGAWTGALRFRHSAGAFELDIEDHGCGFDAGRVGASGGLGITSMKERVRVVGGDLVVDSAPGKGVLIRARVPCVLDTSTQDRVHAANEGISR